MLQKHKKSSIFLFFQRNRKLLYKTLDWVALFALLFISLLVDLFYPQNYQKVYMDHSINKEYKKETVNMLLLNVFSVLLPAVVICICLLIRKSAKSLHYALLGI